MEAENLNIVVSWTDGDDTDCAQYCVALYDGAKPDTVDFVTVDDTNSQADNAAINEIIAGFEREYGFDATGEKIVYDI